MRSVWRVSAPSRQVGRLLPSARPHAVRSSSTVANMKDAIVRSAVKAAVVNQSKRFMDEALVMAFEPDLDISNIGGQAHRALHRATTHYGNSIVSTSPELEATQRNDDLLTQQLELLTPALSKVDPFALVAGQVKELSGSIQELVGSDHPVLHTAAQYFFANDGGKKVRPALVLLMSRAMAVHEGRAPTATNAQVRMAEIAELIHTASLLHDDVVDTADTRRGKDSVNQVFGNKLAVLAGDFVLARASLSLARLRNIEVVEVVSNVIENLVRGEVMQMHKATVTDDVFQYYLRKNYYKTGSLIANTVLSAAMLEGHSEEVQGIAFSYGVAVGQAFQLADDALDFEGSLQSMGKPSLADLKQGFATAPVLFAQDQFPELRPMIERKFCEPDDIDRAASMVKRSGSVERTRHLARAYSDIAIEVLQRLKPSPERDALAALAIKVANRTK